MTSSGSTDWVSKLRAAIEEKTASIGVFGSGYVGLPLACAFAESGFRATAGDSDTEKVKQILSGLAYVEDPYVKSVLPGLVSSGKLKATNDIEELAAGSDISIITVPTPLTEKLEPDLSYVTDVTNAIARRLTPGKLVVLESSVYPGVTEEILRPILERTGLEAGKDFALAHSPERIDYGNPKSLLDIPKVVGGVTQVSTELTCQLYSKILRARVVPVSNARTAEATKMLENAYRFVNIAMINEIAIACERLGLDVYEVISAAATKPFGFQPFYPGPGVGGHCIPKDPHFLSYRARQVGIPLKMVELSTLINEGMTQHIISRLTEHYQSRSEELRNMRVALLGLAFKPNVSDIRRSPAIELAEELLERGADVAAYDPFVKSIRTRRGTLNSTTDIETAAKDAHLLILVTSHTAFEKIDFMRLRSLVRPRPTIFDTRGFLSLEKCTNAGFWYMRLGRPGATNPK
jgi:nucleotide sugar dehydrogenase